MTLSLNHPVSQNALTVSTLTPENVRQQVNLIQQIMRDLMKEGEHYGTIPGTSKPTLYKPGAEKLCLTFRLSPKYTILSQIQEKDFIAYTIKCSLEHLGTGEIIAEGIGSCNSRENKYLYLYTPSSLNPDRKTAAKLKAENKGKWKKQGEDWIWIEMTENPNPWELDNTLVKMACKRALIAATLNATAASDIFIQSFDDSPTLPETPEADNTPVTISDISRQISPELKKLFHRKRLTSQQILELWIENDGNQDSILRHLTKQEAA